MINITDKEKLIDIPKKENSKFIRFGLQDGCCNGNVSF
jgi:hypothetical protein